MYSDIDRDLELYYLINELLDAHNSISAHAYSGTERVRFVITCVDAFGYRCFSPLRPVVVESINIDCPNSSITNSGSALQLAAHCVHWVPSSRINSTPFYGLGKGHGQALANRTHILPGPTRNNCIRQAFLQNR